MMVQSPREKPAAKQHCKILFGLYHSPWVIWVKTGGSEESLEAASKEERIEVTVLSL